jgi:hypothetical protein
VPFVWRYKRIKETRLTLILVHPTVTKGLGFFPQPFLDGYKAIKFEGEAKVMVFFAFGLCGCQMLQSGLVSAQFRTEGTALRISQIQARCFTSNAGDCSDRLGPPVPTDYGDCCPYIVQYTSNTRPTRD